jgi:Cys-tRNA(Pro) deacylase
LPGRWNVWQLFFPDIFDKNGTLKKMAKNKFPMTQAIRVLKKSGVDYTLHLYKYQEKGGTARAARELAVDEHMVLKTLIMEDNTAQPMVVVMHGDKQVSTKAFARFLSVKIIKPCEPKTAHQHTGYQVGGTSPMGLKKPLEIYLEKSIGDLSRIYINAGKRGLLAEMSSRDLISIIKPTLVNISI